MSIESLLQQAEEFFHNLKSHLSPAVQADIKAVQNAGHDLVNAAQSYIEKNGLQDLYAIALTLVGAMAPGASWAGTLAAIEAQAVADGKSLIQGAIGVVAAQAQADLLAAGKSAGLPTPAPTA